MLNASYTARKVAFASGLANFLCNSVYLASLVFIFIFFAKLSVLLKVQGFKGVKSCKVCGQG